MHRVLPDRWYETLDIVHRQQQIENKIRNIKVVRIYIKIQQSWEAAIAVLWHRQNKLLKLLLCNTDFSHLLTLAWCKTMKLLNYLWANLFNFWAADKHTCSYLELLSKLKIKQNFYWAKRWLFNTPTNFQVTA